MGKIFIGYRREDSAGHTGRLFDRLSEHFGKDRVFMDISGIELGVDFVEAIDKAVGSSDAFLVVIGKQWLSATDADGRRRLENPEDFIRLEIATALRRNIRVIPVLVQGATAPSSGSLPEDLKKLSRLHAHEISDSRWDYDVGTLIQTLEKVLKKEATKDEEKKEDKGQPTPPPPPPKFPRWAIAVIAAIVIAIGVYAIWLLVEPRIEMPNVVGVPVEKAKAMLADRGLAVSIRGKQTGEKPPGTVVDQKPEPGTKLKKGDRVDLVLAVKSVIKMPNVREKQIDVARNILSKAGLRVSDEKPIKTKERSPGIVLKQTPEPGVEVEPGQAVILEVAVKSGISVPNVVGEQLEKAKALLAEKGLVVSTVGKKISDKPTGTVLEQDPMPGTEVEPGRKVGLVVAMKPTVANEQQRQMAKKLAEEWYVAFYLRRDISALTQMASIPFIFGKEVLFRLEDIETRWKSFFAEWDSSRKDEVGGIWELKDIKVRTIAEWKRERRDLSDVWSFKIQLTDADFIVLMVVEKGNRRQEGGLFMRNVGGKITLAGIPER